MKVTKYSLRDYKDKYTEVWGATSESNPDKIYTVAMNKRGVWSCGCPRWTMNKSRPDCKHIKYIKAFRENGFQASAVLEAEMPEQVKRKLSTFAAIEV